MQAGVFVFFHRKQDHLFEVLVGGDGDIQWQISQGDLDSGGSQGFIISGLSGSGEDQRKVHFHGISCIEPYLHRRRIQQGSIF
jgi:hypothetical protein